MLAYDHFMGDTNHVVAGVLKPATVIARYGFRTKDGLPISDVVDLEFDDRPVLSPAHATHYVQLIKGEEK